MSRIHCRSGARGFKLRHAREVLGAYKHRSVISGTSTDLTIVKVDPDKPLSPANAMVVTVREALQPTPLTNARNYIQKKQRASAQ